MKTIAILLAAASSALAQDKVKIEIRTEKGAATIHELISKSSGKFKVEQGGQVMERDVLNNEEAEFTETILEVKDGLPVKAERDYKKFSFEKKEFNDEQKANGKRSLEGRKVTLVFEGGRRTKIEAPAEVAAEDVRDLNLRDDAIRKSLPLDAVPVGHSWEAKKEDVLADANDQDVGISYSEGSLKFTFEKIEDRGGDKVAVIKGVGEAKGSMEDGTQVTVKMETTLFYSIAKKDIVENRSTGTYVVALDAEGVRVDGKGQFENVIRMRPQ